MLDTKIIIVDGIPGSGKSTTSRWISEMLIDLQIPNRYYHELEANHPLRIYDRQFTSFANEEEAQWFIDRMKELFNNFVEDRFNQKEITVMESWLFQGTICFAYLLYMDHDKIINLATALQEILQKLNPVLIYFYQEDVERNWRWICEQRGEKFTQGRCSIYTDEDFRRVGIKWAANQEFVHGIVKTWDIPKLIIRNKEYRWDEYRKQIAEFLELARL